MFRILSLAALALALSVPTTAHGESSPALDPGASYISDFFRATVDAAGSANSEEHARAAVAPLLERHIPLDETARFVLGRYWPAADPKSAGRFQTAFRNFAIDAFVRGIRAHPNLALAVGRSRARADGTFVVASELTLPTGATVPLDWQLRKTPSGAPFQIIDVAAAGIDARLMLRNLAAATLADGAGNLDTLIGLFQRSIAPSVAPPRNDAPRNDAMATDP